MRAIWAEILKCRRSLLLGTAVGMPLLFCLAVFLNYRLRPATVNTPLWSWPIYFQTLRALWSVFGGALLTALLAAFSVSMERRNECWKLLLAQPVSKSTFYWAKLLILTGLLALSHLLLLAAGIVAGLALGFEGPLPGREPGLILSGLPALLPVLALQFGLSLAWRSFLPPVAFCLLAHFASLIGSNLVILGLRPGYYLPWSFSLRAFQMGGPDRGANPFDFLLAVALGVAAALLANVYFIRKEE